MMILKADLYCDSFYLSFSTVHCLHHLLRRSWFIKLNDERSRREPYFALASHHRTTKPWFIRGVYVDGLTINAIGRSYSALLISALRLFVFFLPCLWLGSQLGGIEGLFIGALLGNLLAGLNAWLIFRKKFMQITKSQATHFKDE